MGRPPGSVIVVVVFVSLELPADLAAGPQRRVDVGVHRPVADRTDDLRELTGCDALSRWSDDIGRRDGPGYGAARGRAGRLVATAAKKGDDSPAGRPRAP